MERFEKYFMVDVRSRQVKISIDRLKPAYLESSELGQSQPSEREDRDQRTEPITIVSDSKTADGNTPPQSEYQAQRTRTGRVIQCPSRFRE